jgi:hypothetical protein
LFIPSDPLFVFKKTNSCQRDRFGRLIVDQSHPGDEEIRDRHHRFQKQIVLTRGEIRHWRPLIDFTRSKIDFTRQPNDFTRHPIDFTRLLIDLMRGVVVFLSVGIVFLRVGIVFFRIGDDGENNQFRQTQ